MGLFFTNAKPAVQPTSKEARKKKSSGGNKRRAAPPKQKPSLTAAANVHHQHHHLVAAGASAAAAAATPVAAPALRSKPARRRVPPPPLPPPLTNANQQQQQQQQEQQQQASLAIRPPLPHYQQLYNTYNGSASQTHLIQQALPPPAPLAGYLPPPAAAPPPPPPGWLMPGPAALGSYAGQPVIVNQHYYNYVGPMPPVVSEQQQQQQQLLYSSSQALLQPHVQENEAAATTAAAAAAGNRGRGGVSRVLYDAVYEKFENIMTMIDRENLSSAEDELGLALENIPEEPAAPAERSTTTALKTTSKKSGKSSSSSSSKPKRDIASEASSSGGIYAKVDFYANSRLPMDLPPVVLSMQTWPLLCLAAHYSLRVYDPPSTSSPFPLASSSPSSHQTTTDLTRRNTHIFTTSWRTAHKSLLIKSIPLPSSRVLLLSIRGTASFADWAVNISTQPASPARFLDDEGNLCHSGFLALARNLVKPVARRLRQFLREERQQRRQQQQEEQEHGASNAHVDVDDAQWQDEDTDEDDNGNPGRYTLLLTGHSAGGAVASLLYAHMLSSSASCASDLRALTTSFKRIHCVTFGAPPLSLLPLRKPENRPELRRSLFLSFVNEGDPVTRADRGYVRSLLELMASPAPAAPAVTSSAGVEGKSGKDGKSKSSSSSSSRPKKSSPSLTTSKPALPPRNTSPSNNNNNNITTTTTTATATTKPTWPVPSCTLSNAGRLIILRSPPPSTSAGKPKPPRSKTLNGMLSEGVMAATCTEERLRGVIWGDPVCHMMSLYAGRIEALAVEAVTVASVLKNSVVAAGTAGKKGERRRRR